MRIPPQGPFCRDAPTTTPKTADGPAADMRVLRLAKESAVKARTQTMNQLKAVLLLLDPALREQLTSLRNPALITTCAALDRRIPAKATEPRRPPSGKRRPLPHRPVPNTLGRTHPVLPAATHPRRHVQTRDRPLPQTLRRTTAPPASSRRRPQRHLPLLDEPQGHPQHLPGDRAEAMRGPA